MGVYVFDLLPPVLSSLTQLVINSPDNSSCCVGCKSPSTIICVTVQNRRVESTIQGMRIKLSVTRMNTDHNNYANGNQWMSK